MPGFSSRRIELTGISLIPDDAGWTEAQFQRRLIALTHLARSHLVGLAKKHLHTSLADYIKGIQPSHFSHNGTGFDGRVEVMGSLPFMVEHGAKPWDLRITLLKDGTRKLKESKEGHKFLHVPFRHAGPGAEGVTGSPMGSQFTASKNPYSRAFKGGFSESQARKLGESIHTAGQALSATKSTFTSAAVPNTPGLTMTTPGKGTSWGDSLPPNMAPILRSRHTTDIYEGMVRKEKFYESKAQNSYMTFRTISQNPNTKRSDAGGVNWTHPGIKERHLIPKVQTYVGMIFESGAFFTL